MKTNKTEKNWKKKLKIVIKAKRSESEITIIMKTIIYLLGQEREKRKRKKGLSVTTFEELTQPKMK